MTRKSSLRSLNEEIARDLEQGYASGKPSSPRERTIVDILSTEERKEDEEIMSKRRNQKVSQFTPDSDEEDRLEQSESEDDSDSIQDDDHIDDVTEIDDEGSPFQSNDSELGNGNIAVPVASTTLAAESDQVATPGTRKKRRGNTKPRGPKPQKLQFTAENVAAIEAAIGDRAFAIGGMSRTPLERGEILAELCKEASSRTDDIYRERRGMKPK